MLKPALPRIVAYSLLFVFVSYITLTALSLTNPESGYLPYHYYPLFTESLMKGQLTMPIEPRPELLALPDPYDSSANYPYRILDLALYQGKYYLFHGLTPVLLLFLPWRTITGHPLDQAVATLIFCSAGFFLSFLILRRMRTRFAPQIAHGVEAAAVLLLGLGSGTVVLLYRPKIYQVACAAAYACGMASVWLLAKASGDEKRRALWLGAASLAAALCVGARPNYLLFSLIPWIAAVLWGRQDRKLPLYLCATIAPTLLYGVFLAAYNAIRFGSPLEFGVHYQLSFTNLQHAAIVKAAFIPINAWNYLLTPPHFDFSSQFPWILWKMKNESILLGNDFHAAEPTVGLFPTMPVFFLLLGLPLLWKTWGDSDRKWLLLLLTAFAANLFTLLLFNTSALRYVADFQPLAALLTTLVLITIPAQIHSPRVRLAASLSLFIVTAWSLYLGVSFQILSCGPFSQFNS